ncbi:hypothetical protein [Streptomyces sp. NPDC059010]|uniref:hypothetical protein n=1 Tax=Streptomyces sp. NPDC059010 TaxID=3346695 RepID=UPI0036A6663E
MSYVVELAPWVEEALMELSEDDRQDAMESVATALVRKDAWPAPGGWDVTTLSGTGWWITFSAYSGGIEILDLGVLGEPSCTRWRSVV